MLMYGKKLHGAFNAVIVSYKSLFCVQVSASSFSLCKLKIRALQLSIFSWNLFMHCYENNEIEYLKIYFLTT